MAPELILALVAYVVGEAPVFASEPVAYVVGAPVSVETGLAYVVVAEKPADPCSYPGLLENQFDRLTCQNRRFFPDHLSCRAGFAFGQDLFAFPDCLASLSPDLSG